MWLLQNQEFVQFIEKAHHQGLNVQAKLVNIAFHLSLKTAKALWAFISISRGFLVGADDYFFNRVVSAIFGTLTIIVCGLLARRLYQSAFVGILTAVLLSIMPSHVYYSRIALQEAFSAFFFLVGLYCYLFSSKISFRTFLASIFFACVYFVNYRMILIPIFILFCEFYLSCAEGQKINLKKWLYHSLVFFAIVFGLGALDHGANTYVTFGWIFHQSHLAHGTFDVFNFLSYPYYVFKFEGILFGLMFFGNIYFVVKKKWKEAFPFMFVLFFMVLFSFPQEKGVRYLTSAMPFMVMAVAGLISYLYSNKILRRGTVMIVILTFLLVVSQTLESFYISRFKNDYQTSIAEIKKIDREAKFISSQSLIQKMFVDDQKDVLEFKYGLAYLAKLYSSGYRYLIIDPQAYISFTDDQRRFSLTLMGYLEFFRKNISPIKSYEHFNDRMLARFVLEHNENLRQSLLFLEKNKAEHYHKLNVYDLRVCMAAIKKVMDMNHLNSTKESIGF